MTQKKVVIEIRVPKSMDDREVVSLVSRELKVPGFELDYDYIPVPVSPPENLSATLEAAGEEIRTVRGSLEDGDEAQLEKVERVIKVWSDAPIDVFSV